MRVGTAVAEKTLIPTASHEQISKKYKWEIKNKNSHTPKKSPGQQSCLMIQKQESCFHVMAQLVTEMGLVWHP